MRGDRIGLIGNNGVGKTTLLRLLLGELEPQTGTVKLGTGIEVGYFDQLRQELDLEKSVAYNVGEGRTYIRLNGKDRHVVGYLKGFLFSPKRSMMPVKALSGGERNRVVLAKLFTRPANLLVLDEPAANLDPEARQIFFQLLAEKRESAAMLLSSHRLDEVASLVNRVVELDQGRVVLDDKVADLVALSSRLYCSVGLLRPEQAFARAIREWDFSSSDDGHTWTGYVAGPDRLRFLGLLSRYAALLAHIRLDEAGNGKSLQDVSNAG